MPRRSSPSWPDDEYESEVGGTGRDLALLRDLFGVEGTGLLLRKRWAEWMVVIVTGSLLPLECYELFHKPNAVKAVLAAVNLLILAYLIAVIRRKQEGKTPL